MNWCGGPGEGCEIQHGGVHHDTGVATCHWHWREGNFVNISTCVRWKKTKVIKHVLFGTLKMTCWHNQ